MPKVSVIIPVYNVEAYLRQCLDSIVNQTLRDIEIICVDDGSTDGSLDILKSYATKDSRIRIISGDHQGAYRAREKAIKLATGEFLHLMDSDDVLAWETYRECYDLCSTNRLDHLVFTAENFISGENTFEFKRLKRRFDAYYRLVPEICDTMMPGRNLMGEMMKNGRFFVSPPLRFVRMSLVKQYDIQSPNALYHGDNYYTAAWLYIAERAMAVNRKYYKRRLRDSSITTTKGKEEVHFQSILNVIVALCRFEPFQKGAMVSDSIERAYMSELMGALASRSKNVDIAFQCKAVDELYPVIPKEMNVFLKACFLPMFTMVRDVSQGYCVVNPWRKHAQSGISQIFRRAQACYRENGFLYAFRKAVWALRFLKR